MSKAKITEFRTEPFECNTALVCRGLASSLKDQALRSNFDEEVDLDLAKSQHNEYLTALRKINNLALSEIEPREDLPDSVFVEDCAVAVGGVALITRPCAPSRQNEVDEIRRILRDDLRQQIYEIEDPNATLDGGDVLFTGEEFFVGISKRTNSQGANALAKAFPNYPVSSIKVADHLHLKSMMSMAAPGILAVGSSPAAQSALKQILEKSDYDYCTLTLPDDAAANCVYVRGYLLHCTKQEYPNSYKIFEERFPNDVRIPIPNSELHKVDGALTCRCILVQKPL
ncbi:N(G),N(G)-dimethylarginine dimethylaminohydrolase 1-like isoform X2 [Acanthaster planci]|uniref:N(G),N(G)-dimethylarginine dimethylaminohydrolase 1-like isoform X2 n=1 Tax=Acanthaster planci TaxID=133434 RepID=A0A8B7ZYH0_ACAPL|nr:N(G),N(G)-dimethylarginine dimethylaminohydrolase 1-like isoform X2 [Acanthaster planci]XP_022109795.1 N(G),N(G)-dimethylarginine dimethylaminohydrolase 1-like isoform X2 [Acanthaster planci]